MTAPGTNTGTTQSGDASRTADRLKDQAKEQARHALDATAEQTTSAVNTGTDRLAREVRRVADAFHETTRQLREDNQGTLAGATNTVATRIEGVADYLSNTDARQLRRDLSGAVRRNPAVALGGFFALGLIAARFLKSSEPHEEHRFDGGARDFGRSYGSGYGAGTGYGTGYGTGRSAGYGTTGRTDAVTGGYGATGTGTTGSTGTTGATGTTPGAGGSYGRP